MKESHLQPCLFFLIRKTNQGCHLPHGRWFTDQQLQDCHLAGCAGSTSDLHAKRRMLQTAHMSLSRSRGILEWTKLFSYLSCYSEQGEVLACCFPSPDDQQGSAGRQSLMHKRDQTGSPAGRGRPLEGLGLTISRGDEVHPVVANTHCTLDLAL